jgi:hypothetical protein
MNTRFCITEEPFHLTHRLFISKTEYGRSAQKARKAAPIKVLTHLNLMHISLAAAGLTLVQWVDTWLYATNMTHHGISAGCAQKAAGGQLKLLTRNDWFQAKTVKSDRSA